MNNGVTTRRGTVARFNDERGYGFITPDDGGQDIFVHFSGILGEGYRKLLKDQLVEFELEPGKDDKRPIAVNVRVVQP
jgi:CspA family cold shock protein